MMRHIHRARRGFTLIEVMVAAAILASIVAITWGSVSTSFRVRRASLDKFDRYRGVQQALDRMSREISMAFVTNIGQTATNQQGSITYATIFEGDNRELAFTSMSHLRTRVGELAGDQNELTYRVERVRGEDGRMRSDLVRREDTPIDDKPLRGGVVYTLIENVESVRFEYWDPTREIADEAWISQWDAINDHEGKLPSRVRITVEIPDPLMPRRTLTFSTQTEILLVDPILIVPASIMEQLQRFRDATQGGLPGLQTGGRP